VERWIKSAVMATVTVVWTVYMLVGIGKYMFAGESMPDPAIWGIPGMIWLALNPPIPIKKQPEQGPPQ
jgi:hypothetical protein